MGINLWPLPSLAVPTPSQRGSPFVKGKALPDQTVEENLKMRYELTPSSPVCGQTLLFAQCLEVTIISTFNSWAVIIITT